MRNIARIAAISIYNLIVPFQLLRLNGNILSNKSGDNDTNNMAIENIDCNKLDVKYDETKMSLT